MIDIFAAAFYHSGLMEVSNHFCGAVQLLQQVVVILACLINPQLSTCAAGCDAIVSVHTHGVALLLKLIDHCNQLTGHQG